MKVYFRLEKANYAHVYMYVINELFNEKVAEMNLEEADFRLDCKIDGNVAELKLDGEKKVLPCFEYALDVENVKEKNIKVAIDEIEQKTGWKGEVEDMGLLIKKIKEVQWTKEKPKITDDEMNAEGIRFVK